MDNTNTIQELEATKKELLDRVSQIDFTINTLKLVSSFNPSNGHTLNTLKVVNNTLPEKYSDYNKNATIKSKLAYTLKKENRFLHIRQVAEILHGLEVNVEVKDFVTKLYPAIADLRKAGSITKFTVGTSNVNSFWGSKNWLNEDGTIKEGHEFDESQVTSFGDEKIEI